MVNGLPPLSLVQSGRDGPSAQSWLEAEMPGLGSSGGPLVAAGGIVGMVKAGSADDTRVLDIEYIRHAVQDWGYPWVLTASAEAGQEAKQKCMDVSATACSELWSLCQHVVLTWRAKPAHSAGLTSQGQSRW
jgi:hypothetical protein